MIEIDPFYCQNKLEKPKLFPLVLKKVIYFKPSLLKYSI